MGQICKMVGWNWGMYRTSYVNYNSLPTDNTA